MKPAWSTSTCCWRGRAGYLKNPLIHHDYKGIERYFERHNVYSSLEAVEAHRTLTAPGQAQGLPALLGARGRSAAGF